MRNVLLTSLTGLMIAFVATSLEAAPPVPESVIWQEAIEYSNPGDEHLQLNLARPKTGDGPFPAILCIHGGGFRAGKRESYDALCVKLAERGYVAATMTYRLAPKHQFPAAVHDTKAAVRWLRAKHLPAGRHENEYHTNQFKMLCCEFHAFNSSIK
ncbi:MAG: alpha/beta hydrolase fold domain-containing protein [Nitrospiraceae bacterium]|nr:alpha/beta hydrolase fold domain-containing protein [Nitrospiraceae bacterium]